MMSTSTNILAPLDLNAIARRANDAHQRARGAAAQVVEYVIEAGQALNEAKNSIGHGNWLDWLNRNVEFSDRTARLYMRLADTVPALLVHHKADDCWVTPAVGVSAIAGRLKNSSKVETKLFDGGTPSDEGACSESSAHGFLGIEEKVVGAIVDWMTANAPH